MNRNFCKKHNVETTDDDPVCRECETEVLREWLVRDISACIEPMTSLMSNRLLKKSMRSSMLILLARLKDEVGIR